jgi:hypothetical protein
VPARLQPSAQLAVVEEQDARAGGVEHERAAREVSFRDAPVEGVGMAAHERTDARQVAGLVVVRRVVRGQDLIQRHDRILSGRDLSLAHLVC